MTKKITFLSLRKKASRKKKKIEKKRVMATVNRFLGFVS